jgi:NAD(P)H-hydrate epimerase
VHERVDLEDLWLSREVVRRVDAAAMTQLGMPGLLLMENAARGVVDVLTSQAVPGATPGTVTIVCGPGNNGGDGLAVGRLLAARGRASEIFLIRNDRELTPDAAANLAILQKAGVIVRDVPPAVVVQSIQQLTGRDWLVDALLGTGMRGEIQPPFRDIIQAANESPAHVLAVDLPSGLDCDEGRSLSHCIRAECTVTFVAGKLGFRNPDSAAFTGRVVVADIGIPSQWIRTFVAEQQTRGAVS